MNFQEWMSITVAMLAAISAIVICWQVYVLIDMRSLRKDFERLRMDNAMEKQTQRRAMREFAAETKLLEAGRIIGSFDKEKRNYDAISYGYISLIHALKLMVNQKSEMIDEILGLMRKCVYLAQFYDAWDEVFGDDIEQLSKEEYYFITSGLMGFSNYVSQIDDIRKWRQTKKMDKDAYDAVQAELLSNNSVEPEVSTTSYDNAINKASVKEGSKAENNTSKKKGE